MPKTEKMYSYIQTMMQKIPDIQSFIYDSLALGRILFTPQFIEFNHVQQPFTLALQQEILSKIKTGQEFTLRIYDQQSETVIQQINQIVLERHYLTKEQFMTKGNILFDYMDERMKLARFGYLRPYDEFLYHNIEKITYRAMVEEEQVTARHPKKRDKTGEIIVDGYYFAGYDIFYLGFCFTSCWRMYFGEDYSTILPLDLLREVQQVEQVKDIHTNTVFIELYRNPYLWDHPQNLEYQRRFRDQLGIDQLSRMDGVGVLKEPYVEFQIAQPIHQIIQYQNDFFQPVPKHQATHFVTWMYNPLTKKQKISRVKGVLNAQAFFPIIDDRRKRMADMVTLFLEQTIDEGLEAYEYYIRNHLEIEFHDKKYATYTPVLTFVLADEVLAELPLQKLQRNMPDVSFSSEKKQKNKRSVKLIKDSNTLEVEFLPLSIIYQKKSEQTN
ncbi:hypothetical protein [Candidatus Enterococcus willemsii]|uniref:Uncharacterized protein n=1 Tax=Candidatus Enterococcus willemsii TaxID=1857215 RepID=A0ABQ6Z2N1_9ENTE|nr:hypothetical protein [Enterococcus sp. CU12B]KAF1306043.1 hypothetical protein BAU17_03500 [Enterococcus sp. CU12B]